jgi:hypothetical protein
LLSGHDDWFSHAAALRASSIKYSRDQPINLSL